LSLDKRVGEQVGSKQADDAIGIEEGAKRMSGAGADDEKERTESEGEVVGSQAPRPRPYEALFKVDEKGRTLLFDAAERGRLDVVEKLIFRLAGTGLSPMRLALITWKDHAGLTAAEVAEQNGHREIVRLLHSEQGRMEYFG